MTPPVSLSNQDPSTVAREIGFGQCVLALRRVLMTTPAGWLLVDWISWDRVPHERILVWSALFFAEWVLALWMLRRMMRQGPASARHAPQLIFVAMLDGIAWGSCVWILMGFSLTLDPWLGALLCGVGAINAPVYITYIRAYRALIGSLWAMVILGALLRPDRMGVREQVFGLTIFFGLIAYYMQSIAERVLEGIRLQLSNASLAQQLNEALQLVKHEAQTDALTGQPNRRALDVMLKQQLGLAQFPGLAFSVLLLDIDHFKLINDAHGHGVGDDTLRAFAQRVREHLRQGDACARYGGEEFVVVLPRTALASALDVAERLRRGVADQALLAVPPIRATVSIGAAQYVPGESIERLLDRADAAVYAAKHGGRNQVRVPEDAVDPA